MSLSTLIILAKNGLVITLLASLRPWVIGSLDEESYGYLKLIITSLFISVLKVKDCADWFSTPGIAVISISPVTVLPATKIFSNVRGFIENPELSKIVFSFIVPIFSPAVFT